MMTRTKKPLMMTSLKNMINKLDPELEPRNVRNIRINGEKRGCSGFFVNHATGKTVYFNTEESCFGPLFGKALVRYAKNESDWTGERNQFVELDDCASQIVRMLTEGAN